MPRIVLPWAIWTPYYTWFLGPSDSASPSTPNGISVGLTIFAALTSVTATFTCGYVSTFLYDVCYSGVGPKTDYEVHHYK